MASCSRPIPDSYRQQSRILYSMKRDKLNIIPDTFLNTDLSRLALLNLIHNIECCRENQNSIDNMYDDFCNNVISDMNKFIPYDVDCSRKTRKRYKYYKPYWDEHLENLWKNVRSKEK